MHSTLAGGFGRPLHKHGEGRAFLVLLHSRKALDFYKEQGPRGWDRMEMFFFVYFVVLEMEPRALCMLEKCSTTEPSPAW